LHESQSKVGYLGHSSLGAQPGWRRRISLTRGPEHVHHPAKCTSPKSHNSLSLNNHKMVNEEDMKAALAEIETLEDLNYCDIACKFKLTYITLL
jgi:hypothetical protein